jgi:DNA polymerase
VSLPRSCADGLRYLAEIGWEHLYLEAPKPARAAPSAVSPAVADPAAAAVPANLAEAAGGLASLAARAAGCTACRLCETRRKVVFGVGSPRARLMFVGEGPGAEEDRQGLPFVGRAGELLDRMLRAIDLDREQVYIANVVKCRPPGNRDPLPDEVAACADFLAGQIDAVRPSVLVCLGRIAAQTLLGDESPVGRLRGGWHRVRGVETRVTYHPAALLRNPALRRPTWEDLQEIRDRLRAAGGGPGGETRA